MVNLFEYLNYREFLRDWDKNSRGFNIPIAFIITQLGYLSLASGARCVLDNRVALCDTHALEEQEKCFPALGCFDGAARLVGKNGLARKGEKTCARLA